MIPQFPEFKRLELSDKAAIEKITSQYPPYSDFNFVSMWSWDIKGEMRISILNKNVVVRFCDYITGEPFYSFLGNNRVNETAKEILHIASIEKVSPKLQLIPEVSSKELDETLFYVLESREHFDYIYYISELYACHGSKYATQRNLLNRFIKKYADIRVEILPLHKATKDILELNKRWNTSKILKNIDEIELRNETIAIERIFNMTSSDLVTVGVYQNEELIGYSISEILKEGYALCHFAKADTSFFGVYSFVMNQTCKMLLSQNIVYLNYEQDLGFPYLRHSKMAFRPKSYLTKFVVVGI